MKAFCEVWDINRPHTFEHIDQHTSTVEKSLGGGVSIGVDGVQLIAKGGRYKAHFHHTKPGIHGVYYLEVGSKLYLGTSKQQLLAMTGKAPKQAEEGVVYVFSKDGLKRYRGDVIHTPTYTDKLTLEQGAEELWNLLNDAAEDTYNLLGRPLVVTPISGGTDGLLTALALKEIGANQLCVCVGTDEGDFDPYHAAQYAKTMGLPYQFLKLPANDSSLIHLRDRAIKSFEAYDFSNVLMAMCYKMIGDYAVEHGAKAVYNADFADVILGNDILTTGSFNKAVREGRETDSDFAWAKYRIEHSLHTLPTSVMTLKIFEDQGLDSRQIFYARPVIDFLLRQTRELTPAATDKRLYKAILNTWLPDGVWNTKRKVGFYTGAGIGTIRLKNPILQDANLKAAYDRIFSKEKP